MSVINPELLAYFLIALSFNFLFLSIFWNFLIRRNRMKRKVLGLSLGNLERYSKKKDEIINLRGDLPTFYIKLSKIFGFMNKENKPGLVSLIRMAGYRGQSAIIKIFVIRSIAPGFFLIFSFIFITYVLNIEYSIFIVLFLSICMGLLGWFAPLIYLKNRVLKRQKEIRLAWPEVLDLLLICVEAGMGLEAALLRASEEIKVQSKIMSEELSILLAELSFLQDRRSAYNNLYNRTGVDSIKAASTSLLQAEKFGTSLAPTLRILASESREIRMSMAEAKAAALPPKLTVPMIIFFLPVLLAIIIAPAIIQITQVQ